MRMYNFDTEDNYVLTDVVEPGGTIARITTLASDNRCGAEGGR